MNIRKFCPHCNTESVQEFIAEHICDPHKVELKDILPTAYYFYSCNNCNEALLYSADIIVLMMKIDEETGNGPELEEATRDPRIKEYMELLWPEQFEDIHKYVPAPVRESYLKALKHIGSPQLFATELRKALEVVCDECGIGRTDKEGKHIDLSVRISLLADSAKLPFVVKDVAHKIRLTANDAVHTGKEEIKAANIPILRNFFKTLINHVFVLPLQKEDWEKYKAAYKQ